MVTCSVLDTLTTATTATKMLRFIPPTKYTINTMTEEATKTGAIVGSSSNKEKFGNLFETYWLIIDLFVRAQQNPQTM